jgi:hypothetical protein
MPRGIKQEHRGALGSKHFTARIDNLFQRLLEIEGPRELPRNSKNLFQ